MPSASYSLAIHGGAGTIRKSQMTPTKEARYHAALKQALLAGQTLLKEGATSAEAVAAAVRFLEDSELFNAGRGSVFSAEGKHEMEASVMEGNDLQAGAVAQVQLVKNPVDLAMQVMKDKDYVLLSGAGAMEYAHRWKMKFESADYFYTSKREEEWKALRNSDQLALDHSDERKFGTVGAVALDVHGNVAAATSTGGLTNKKFGRLGDSAIIGAGTYANNATCAVSCTGWGEQYLRGVVAYDVSALMEYKGLSLQAACEEVILQKQPKLGGEGGLVAVDVKGNLALVFNSEGMYRGSVSSQHETPEVGIYGQ